MLFIPKPSTINCGTAGHGGCSGMLISPMRDERFLVPPGERRANIITRIDKQRARSSEERCALVWMRAFAAEHAKAKWSGFDTLSVPDAQTTHAFTLFLTPFYLILASTPLCVLCRQLGPIGAGDLIQSGSVSFSSSLQSLLLEKVPTRSHFQTLLAWNAPQNTYCMEFSMRVMVRKAARLAVYEEMTMRANIHQTPIIIRVARVVYGTSPPGKQKTPTRKRRLMHSNRK